MADIFISYAREDAAFALRLVGALKARGREVWVDQEEIAFTAKWWDECRDGIASADAVICVVSPDWTASATCQAELDHAVKLSKRLVPVVVREPPASEVPPDLAQINWFVFGADADFEAQVDELVEVLAIDLDRATCTPGCCCEPMNGSAGVKTVACYCGGTSSARQSSGSPPRAAPSPTRCQARPSSYSPAGVRRSAARGVRSAWRSR